MTEKVRVGLVGVGMMGAPMGRRVLTGGYPLTVMDVRPEREQELVKEGARQAKTPKEVAQMSDIVLTSLPTLAACEEVYHGNDGLLKGTKAGQILVETSTVPPSMIRNLYDEAKKQSVAVIDAAINARTLRHPGQFELKANEIMAKGEVTLMVGGDPDTVEKVKPVLATFGNPIIYFGPVGSGETIKVLNNAMAHACYVVLAELVGVAVKAGVNVPAFLDEMTQTGAVNRFMEKTIPHYLKTGSGTSMRNEAALKDAESILQLGRELNVPLPLQSTTHFFYQWAASSGLNDRPWDEAMLKVCETLMNKPIRSK